MKKENTFFRRLFGPKDQLTEMGSPTPVTITSYSQPHVLRQKMKEQNMTHGQTARVNLSPVRLESSYDRKILYFCPMKSIEVFHTISDGDGGSIPAEAKVDGLTVPIGLEDGYYILKNVTITSNGTMQVKATEETEWEKVHHEVF